MRRRFLSHVRPGLFGLDYVDLLSKLPILLFEPVEAFDQVIDRIGVARAHCQTQCRRKNDGHPNEQAAQSVDIPAAPTAASARFEARETLGIVAGLAPKTRTRCGPRLRALDYARDLTASVMRIAELLCRLCQYAILISSIVQYHNCALSVTRDMSGLCTR